MRFAHFPTSYPPWCERRRRENAGKEKALNIKHTLKHRSAPFSSIKKYTGCYMSDIEGVLPDKYLLQRCVSRGGIASVYAARRQGEESDEVAVKVFRPGYAQRESFREYFMAGAEKIAHFAHPHILPLLEYGESEGLLYTVTPFIATGTLEGLLKRVGGRFSAIQALPILRQLCSALLYIHEHNVIHGNIKPSNVFVASDGRMLLADFGIARGYDDSQQSLTRMGWGLAEYAAPEQSLGVLRPASDIYALGVLLFRILTGAPPFTGQTPVEVLLKHVRQPLPSARTTVPSISDAVDSVLRIAMQKRSDDRFASADEFYQAFLRAVMIAPVASPVARAVPPPQPRPESALAPGADKAQMPSAQMSPSLLPSSVVEPATGKVAKIGRQSFLRDDKGATPPPSTGPTEWSPLASATADDSPDAVPLTAKEYLRKKSPAPPATTEEESHGSSEEDSKEHQHWLRRWLPIVIVVLFLLGLLGTLLSVLFYHTGGSGTSTGQTIAMLQRVAILV
jgi:serine/threonine protein kinase